VPRSNPAWIAAIWLIVAACVRESSPDSEKTGQSSAREQAPSASSAPAATPGPTPQRNAKCVVLLHGKGGGAQASTVAGGIEYLRPGGNGNGWGGREWRYFPEDRYQQVREAVARALDSRGCARAVIQGFSNGGAAAAKLYCRGEDFDGRVVGYLIDDPVPDHGVVGCRPAAGVRVKLSATGALSVANDGWRCASQDWTCEGGSTIGIERYARELGTEVTRSIHTTHTEYETPPEPVEWLQ
jgi:pimeloyl-ACP methyl ester carboxylesterase